MPVIRKSIAPFLVACAVASAPALAPAVAFAKPTQISSVKIPAGATLQKMNNGSFAMRGRSGGGLNISGTYSCSCDGTSGSCSTVQTEGVLQCGKDGDTCNGACSMTTTTKGGGKIMMMKRN